ncbi:hypothetical protein MTP03_27990 [Tsukamurella sp. PLM1]|nr:hypothetical protein MTP03_27990 [Tsukamurella sp. PLM1]
MFEWSEEDLMVRDALRAFIDKEVRPHVDELETGALPPYDITRKMLQTFGIDQVNRENLEAELAAEEAGTSPRLRVVEVPAPCLPRCSSSSTSRWRASASASSARWACRWG